MFPEAVKFPFGVQFQYLGIFCALLYTFHESYTITLSSSFTWGILTHFKVTLVQDINGR